MSITIGTPALMGEVNAQLVKRTIKDNPKITKPLIAKQIDLSIVTTGKIVDSLVESKEVLCIGHGESTGGRKAMRYVVNKNHELLLAVLIKNNSFNLEIINYVGETLTSSVLHFTKEDKFETLCTGLDSLIKENPDYNIMHIGIAVPGTTSQNHLSNIPSIPEWEGFSLSEKLYDRYGIPILVENDINILTIGAHDFFYDKQAKNIFLFHVHSGIGSGIVLENILYKSTNNFAGELAYMNIAGELGLTGKENNIEDILIELFDNPPKNKELIIKIIGKMSSNIICTLEPDMIIVDTDHFLQEDVPSIKAEIGRFVPEKYIPNIRVTCLDNSVYFKGLYKIVFDSSDPIFSVGR